MTVVLLAGLGWGSFELIPRLASYPLPGNQQGYAPEQPVAFSHRLHAGELQIACLYCHFGAEKGQHAGFPATSLCMNCHRLVSANWDATFHEYMEALRTNQPPKRVVSPEVQKLYDSLGLDSQLQPDPARTAHPIPWVKVHNLPAYACFDHHAPCELRREVPALSRSGRDHGSHSAGRRICRWDGVLIVIGIRTADCRLIDGQVLCDHRPTALSAIIEDWK